MGLGGTGCDDTCSQGVSFNGGNSIISSITAIGGGRGGSYNNGGQNSVQIGQPGGSSGGNAASLSYTATTAVGAATPAQGNIGGRGFSNHMSGGGAIFIIGLLIVLLSDIRHVVPSLI